VHANYVMGTDRKEKKLVNAASELAQLPLAPRVSLGAMDNAWDRWWMLGSGDANVHPRVP
jgi:hypothetical protein